MRLYLHAVCPVQMFHLASVHKSTNTEHTRACEVLAGGLYSWNLHVCGWDELAA